MCGPDSSYATEEASELTPAEQKVVLRSQIKESKRLLSINKTNAKHAAKEWNRQIKEDQKRIAALGKQLAGL